MCKYNTNLSGGGGGGSAKREDGKRDIGDHTYMEWEGMAIIEGKSGGRPRWQTPMWRLRGGAPLDLLRRPLTWPLFQLLGVWLDFTTNLNEKKTGLASHFKYFYG